MRWSRRTVRCTRRKKAAENDAAEGLYRKVEAIVHPTGAVAASVRGAPEADGVESIQRGPEVA
jgi:hypothetical protein